MSSREIGSGAEDDVAVPFEKVARRGRVGKRGWRDRAAPSEHEVAMVNDAFTVDEPAPRSNDPRLPGL